MQGIFFFLGSTAGRLTRIGAGIVLVLVGILGLQATAGLVLAAIGLVPIAAGAFDLCLFAPIAGLPISGSKLRSAH